MSSIDQIPPSIVKAICQIKASLQSVSKNNKNQHGGWSFASTDDIYAAVTKKMGEVGLVILPLELGEPEIKRIEKDGKTAQWLHVSFQFVLATEEATWSDRHSKRTLYIAVNGPQTFQAAASYAEKAYLRSLFKIPTGDMDLDSLPQAEFEEDQVAMNGNGRKRKSSSAAKKDGTDKVFNEIKARFEQAGSPEELRDISREFANEQHEMPERWQTILSETYDDRMTDLRGRLS